MQTYRRTRPSLCTECYNPRVRVAVVHRSGTRRSEATKTVGIPWRVEGAVHDGIVAQCHHLPARLDPGADLIKPFTSKANCLRQVGRDMFLSYRGEQSP